MFEALAWREEARLPILVLLRFDVQNPSDARRKFNCG